MEGGIQKRLIYAGRGVFPDYTDGGKAVFHFKVVKCDAGETCIDDTKKYGRPMELVFGKKFKIECWETCLKTMQLSEVAEFFVPANQLLGYAPAAKQLRDYFLNKPPEQRHHCCAMMACEHGLGYADLDELFRNPQPLKFVLELVRYEEPDMKRTEGWLLNADEKRQRVPELKAEGNNLYEEKQHVEAERKYAEAVTMLDELMLREKPDDVEWCKLWDERAPILLNLCQCKLVLKEYYAVISMLGEFLEKEPNNVKGLYKRAKAHGAVGNYTEARADYEKVKTLDAKLAGLVSRELHALDEEERKKDQEDRERYRTALRADAKQLEPKDNVQTPAQS